MTDARDRLVALLDPVTEIPNFIADRLLADPRTLLAAALATDEGKAALAEALCAVHHPTTGRTHPTGACESNVDHARAIAAAVREDHE